MKTALKITAIILSVILIISLCAILYFYLITKNDFLDENKLINMDKTITYYDKNQNVLFKEGDEKTVTEIENIPEHVKNAFIAIEDKRFYKHKGVDYKGLIRATLTNIKTFSFKEGGSTISQQLIKNTHLSNKKTFKRKLTEIKLAKELEKKYTKDEILEKYLNTIYFGDNCYGITKATKHYFNKTPSDLTINEGAALAGMIKAPSNYSPFADTEKCNKRKNIVLQQMYSQGYINQEQLEQNVNLNIQTTEREQKFNNFDYYYLVRKELNKIIQNNPYCIGNLKVYVGLDKCSQNNIEKNFENEKTECDKSAILMDSNGKITAYYSTCGNIDRQVGSTIKPLLVYAPAIENDVVYSCSIIKDEKTDFNGYSPSNYNEKYYGNVSVKESLAKSLNVCAVKLLNYTGVEKAKSYLSKTNFNLTENDNSLCLALGATEKGAKLTELCSAYDVFLNDGNYFAPYTIERVESENGDIIYKHQMKSLPIFSKSTTNVVNDMLEYTVKNGTAKKLSFSDIPLCSKTGTVGNNCGNLDAYNISYNSKQLLGVWFGNKDNFLMNNSISGGTKPTILASNIWKELYKDKLAPCAYNQTNEVTEKYIDKMEYENNNLVLLANEHTPMRYKIKTIFKKSALPPFSNNFIEPSINEAKLKLVNGKVEISINLPEYYQALIYRTSGSEKKLIIDTKDKSSYKYYDNSIIPNSSYVYSIVPYFSTEKEIFKGKEIILQKIKIPNVDIDEWWENDLN